ncbi:MAG: hypothetical protein NZZ60_04925 [Bacteroidia bacterium]|nr:hypothetical protein [Bacteroidia bacterium]MCX7652564.1 hypothetical protein [Bacteroidia bacterium]MDW8417560.1 hypothetical protein [Bacteroidia bacterium]
MHILLYFSYGYTIAVFALALFAIRRSGWHGFLLGIIVLSELSRLGHLLFLSQNPNLPSPGGTGSFAPNYLGVYIIFLSSLASGAMGFIAHERKISPIGLWIAVLCGLELVTAFYLWIIA